MPLKTRTLLIVLLALAVTAFAAAEAKKPVKKPRSDVPTRIHYSGNISGDLEPCG